MFVRIAAPLVLGIAALSGCADNPNTQPANGASVKNAPIPNTGSANGPESPRDETKPPAASGPTPAEPKVEEKKQPGGGK